MTGSQVSTCQSRILIYYGTGVEQNVITFLALCSAFLCNSHQCLIYNNSGGLIYNL